MAKKVKNGKKFKKTAKKAMKYKVAGRVAVQPRNAPQAPMAGPFTKGPLTSTAAVMKRMQAMKGGM